MIIIERLLPPTDSRGNPIDGDLVWTVASSHSTQTDADAQMQRFIEDGVDLSTVRFKEEVS